MIDITCENCMNLMRRFPDKFFNLSVVDPPYGIGKDWEKRYHTKKRKTNFIESSYKNDTIPPPEYFEELFRVSNDVIIFGYNYFSHILGPTNYLLIWDKISNSNDSFHYSQAEIAYTSIHKPIQVIRVPWDGWRMGQETRTKKIHPHQKPIELYEKILRKYARPGWKILDTHMGSGSSVIACHRLNLDITACEIDPVYFKNAKKRIDLETKQQFLFPAEERRLQEACLFNEHIKPRDLLEF